MRLDSHQHFWRHHPQQHVGMTGRMAALRRDYLPADLAPLLKLVQEFPDQPFVLDHIAQPVIRDRRIHPWKEDLEALARCGNVHCKLSGLVTEARWGQWRPEDFHRYLDIVIGAFGTERVMIGSDWPVCTLSGEYAAVMRIVLDYVRQFPAKVRDDNLGGNCARFYCVNHSTKKPS